ncbi:MAG: alpha-amylase family glycosyl hydrolase [Stellaceae bacterium]
MVRLGPEVGLPNNWLSRFDGSTWEWDEGTGQYYYQAFLPQQPDLNLHNPEVRQAFAEVLRFWRKRGVDGFSVDASAVLAEDPMLRRQPAAGRTLNAVALSSADKAAPERARTGHGPLRGAALQCRSKVWRAPGLEAGFGGCWVALVAGGEAAPIGRTLPSTGLLDSEPTVVLPAIGEAASARAVPKPTTSPRTDVAYGK